MPQTAPATPATPAEFERIKQRIAENVRTELARAKISHTSLIEILGLHRSVASRRWSGDTAYFAYEIATLAAVLDVPAERLLDCDLRPAASLPDPATVRRHIQEQDDMNTRPAGADQ